MKRSLTTTAVAAAVAAGLLAATAAPASAATLGSSEVVASWYQDFLGRPLAAARNDLGHLAWADRLDAGEPRAQVLADITRTPEYARTNVTQVYRVLLERDLDPGAAYWLQNVPRGMALEWVEQNVLASREFRGTSSSRGYVEDLYAVVLGREPRAGETRYWTGRLRATSPLITVRELWYSDEAADLRLTAKYQLLLGRTPNAGEIAYWRGSEKQSDLSTSIAFASSPEYFPLAPAAADARALAEGATPEQPTTAP